MNPSPALLASAIAGILFGAPACNKSPEMSGPNTAASPGANETAAATGAKHSCRGQNACKGQGGCKTDKHACKGQNDCKGQGGCNM